uniref:Uncharacterized protein TCIL3000_11_11530 n=1 Tax=Trypanosoma congolense (strain IL3000) TaxID=1068625 RepID=G0V1Z1_TRYCI|nr:unnamed protein product [Trypanosoma congolense IL3000]
MSWAAVAQRTKDVSASPAEPKRVVFAVESATRENNASIGSDDGNKTGSVGRVTAGSDESNFSVPKHEKGLLILDANAFIKNMYLSTDVADVLVTTSQVITEVRDRAARQMLDCLPAHLHVMEPTSKSLKAIIGTAKETGDFGVMSRTDIRLCALALDCCIATGTRLEPIKPRAPVINPDPNDGTLIVEQSDAGNEVGEGEEVVCKENDGSEVNHHDANVDDEENVEEEAEGSDDDNEGWITPENIQFCKAVGDGATSFDTEGRFEGGVACVTSDYAMQNTLLHAGVPIVGPHGMKIRELRQWLLRCTACFTINKDTTRQFCCHCGAGNTLRRVQYVVTRSGERKLLINFRKQISTRGTVFNLPKPRGGRHGTNKWLVLREDQLAHVIRGTTSMKMREKIIAAGGGNKNDDDLAAFGEAPRQRKRNPDQPRVFSSYPKFNVNERRKLRAARRK